MGYNMTVQSTGAFAELMAALLAISGVILLVGLVLVVLAIIAQWRIFKKAGEAGWAALIPFYCNYVLAKITWGNGWIFVVPWAAAAISFAVPDIAWLMTLVNIAFNVITCWKLSKAFGHDVGYTVGLVLVPTIFQMILAFSKDAYTGVPQDVLCLKKNES